MRLAIGDIVKVTNICDDEGLTREMFEERGPNPGLGRFGLVVTLHGRDQGCGESIKRPFVVLRFCDKYENGYWPEELEMIRKRNDETSSD